MSEDEEIMTDSSEGGNESEDVSEELEVAKNEDKLKFKVLTPKQIMEKPLDLIREVNEVLQVHPMIARQVLQYFNWNKENAVTRYYTEREKIMKAAQIPNPDELKDVKDFPEVMECTICFDDVKKKDLDALPCGHIFCKGCWNDFLGVKVLKEGSSKIKCPKKGCNLMMDELSVLRLLKNEEARDKFTTLCAKDFVMDKKGIRWCPSPNCTNAIQAELSQAKPVTCACGMTFCFMCGNADHPPANCDMINQWNKRLECEGENVKFLAQNTKECPKCKILIWKDHGCQYMRCQKCSHAFCWLCLGAFDHKAHNCNKYQGEAEEGSERAEWNRYTFFYERWKGHSDSAKFEKELINKANLIIQRLTKEGMNWIDAQYILKAAEQLKEARQILATSYIYGFYLPKGTHIMMFENYQGFLEQATEELSQILEDKEGKSVSERQKVLNLTANLKTRLDNFIEAVNSGGFKAQVEEQATKTKKDYKIDVKYDGWIYNAGN